MSDRVSEEMVDDVLDDSLDYDKVVGALGGERIYVEDGRRVDEPSGRPDGKFWEDVSPREVEEFAEAYEAVASSYRSSPINEKALYSQIAEGEVTFWAPWNLGQQQIQAEVAEQLDTLEEYAQTLESLADLEAEIKVYGLDPYAENNGNNPAPVKQTVKDNIRGKQNVDFVEWNKFREETLEGDWDEEKTSAREDVEEWPEGRKEDLQSTPVSGDGLEYAAMRLAESRMMGGKVRLSPGFSEDDGVFVPTSGETGEDATQLEGVIYGPFIGPWKSKYNDNKDKIPFIFEGMNRGVE
jgi:hypothetical protein